MERENPPSPLLPQLYVTIPCWVVQLVAKRVISTAADKSRSLAVDIPRRLTALNELWAESQL